MNARNYLAGAAVCALAGALMGTACYAQRYGNGPQYSTPAEQAQTQQLNEQAISGTTQSPAVLNGEAPSDQSGAYGAPSTDQSSGYTGYSSGQGPAARNPPSSGGYYGAPTSSYDNQQQPSQNYANPPSASPGYYAQPSGSYGNPPNNSPGYYGQPSGSYGNPPTKYYEPPTTNYGNPGSAYPYGPTPNSDNANTAPHFSEQRQPSNSQLRYESQLSQYREQQAQYRRDQLHYRGELSAYDRAMDEWYNPVPVEEYP
jgi:hypothetical protein